MSEEQTMEELSLEQTIEKPRKRRRSRGFGDPLEVEATGDEELLEEETVEEPVAEKPAVAEEERAQIRHHETLVRPMTRTKPVPKRGMKAAVRVRP